MSKYTTQAAIDAQTQKYGNEFYWDYLESSAKEAYAFYKALGKDELAEKMLTRTLGEALQGNDGD